MSGWTVTAGPAPDAILVVPPSWFSGEWSSRPTTEIVIGLRLNSEETIQVGKAEASKRAADLYFDPRTGNVRDLQSFTEAFNDALVRHLVARGMCDPNDRTKPHPLFPMPEDQVQIAFTSEGARAVWEALERLHLERNPTRKPLNDDEVTHLVALLLNDTLAALAQRDPGRAIRARKLLSAVLEEVVAFEPPAHEPPPG